MHAKNNRSVGGILVLAFALFSLWQPARAATLSSITFQGSSAPACAANTGVLYFDSTTGSLKFCNNAGGFSDVSSGAGTTQWTTNGSAIYYTTGNVGVGIASSSAKLDVLSTDAAYAANVLNSRGDASGNGLQVITRWNVDSNFVARFATNSGSNEVMALKGSGNVGIGTASPAYRLHVAGNFNVDGTLNVNGVRAFFLDTTYSNLFLGNAGTATTSVSATANTAAGVGAFVVNTTGHHNSAIGAGALAANTTGFDNLAIGASALLANTSGSDNTALGFKALTGNRTGVFNTAIGSNALILNVSGSSNVAVGNSALYANTGSNNTAVGASALYYNSTGSYNVAVGLSALTANTTGSNNAALGYTALTSNSTGTNNTGIGHQSLSTNSTGTNNTGLGYQSLYRNATSSGNVAVGALAGYSLVSGDSNTFIGNNAGNSGSQKTSVVNSTAIGNGAYTTADNQVVIGNSSVTQTVLYGTLTVGGGTGKIDAGTIDPPYTIGGKKYATYSPGMTGVKEETTGVARVRDGVANIDLAHAEEGSDLWLFARTANLAHEGLNNVTVLLTPNFAGSTWYEKKDGRVMIHASAQSGEVSYRLTAPRFDHEGSLFVNGSAATYGNRRSGGTQGFNLDELLHE